MPDGDMPAKLIQDALIEGLSHKPHSGMHSNPSAIGGSNASALLTPMLKGIEGEIGQPGHILARGINAEDTTTLM